MKKQQWNMETAMRVLAYALVIIAYVLLLASLSSCELVMGVARVFGVSPSPEAAAAARKVDEALSGWIWALIGVAGSESTRAAVKVHKKRRARRQASPSTET